MFRLLSPDWKAESHALALRQVTILQFRRPIVRHSLHQAECYTVGQVEQLSVQRVIQFEPSSAFLAPYSELGDLARLSSAKCTATQILFTRPTGLALL